jgi:hypothetical protein
VRDLDAPPAPKPFVLDLAWIDQLPEPRRSQAKAEWARFQASAERAAWPDRLDKVLADGLSAMRQQFTQPTAEATG